jgi:superfamily II DNA/RNA helicase
MSVTRFFYCHSFIVFDNLPHCLGSIGHVQITGTFPHAQEQPRRFLHSKEQRNYRSVSILESVGIVDGTLRLSDGGVEIARTHTCSIPGHSTIVESSGTRETRIVGLFGGHWVSRKHTQAGEIIYVRSTPIFHTFLSQCVLFKIFRSGKTLAYVLPLMQQLKQQELFEGYERRPKRPRVLILAPTRELATQITNVLKSLSHTVKLSTQALVGGHDKGIQRKSLESRPVDVVVATPGRLLYHWKNNNIFLGNVRSVVLDEMDTMLEQGFARELRELLYPLLYSADPKEIDDAEAMEMKDTAPQVVMTSATMTQSIQKLLGDNPKTSKLSISAKRLHTTGDGEEAAADPRQHSKLKLPKMKIISAPGLHKAVPRLEQVFIDVGNTDKMSLLLDVVASEKNKATIIFCNTASSVRAVQYALSEARIESIGYHGELNSATRTENLLKFRKGARRESSADDDDFDDGYVDESMRDPNILVCTDIGARGLDIPEVDSVVMFDFPLNAMDYL